MQFAIDEKNGKAHISEALNDKSYFCPLCGRPVIQRHGKIKVEHFAHAKGYLCTDSWHYEEMSEWHRHFQNYYPRDCQEYVMSHGTEKHRADVFINNTVIEFQHSPLSTEEFQERNQFYTGLGYRVIWLFDARDAFNKTLIEDSDFKNLYHWKYAPKTLKELDLHQMIHIYFQIKEQKSGEKSIIRLISSTENGLSTFKSISSEHYSEKEFVQITSFGRQAIARKNNIDKICEPFHILYAVRRINGEREYWGCPLNVDGYAPMIRELKRQCCDTCSYCLYIDDFLVKCSGRYKTIADDIFTIIGRLNSIDDDSIISVEYINKEGDIRQYTPSPPEFPGRTLLELSEQYNAGILIVRNIISGKKYKITKPVSEYINKYHKVYGYYWNDHYNEWSKRSSEIYYAQNPAWIVEWFRTKKETESYRNSYK